MRRLNPPRALNAFALGRAICPTAQEQASARHLASADLDRGLSMSIVQVKHRIQRRTNRTGTINFHTTEKIYGHACLLYTQRSCTVRKRSAFCPSPSCYTSSSKGEIKTKLVRFVARTSLIQRRVRKREKNIHHKFRPPRGRTEPHFAWTNT